jgi:hypothetical protein
MTARAGVGLIWRDGAVVELVDGYTLSDTGGRSVGTLSGVAVAVEGGFLHVAQPHGAAVQMVSAPSVLRITYEPR